MIFKIFYGLVYAGWFATTVLLGGYMIDYTTAREFDLAIFFTITPISIFFRPLVSSYADRTQTHKSLLLKFLVLSFLAYCPFLAWPFLRPYYQTLTSGTDNSSGIDTAIDRQQPIDWPFWTLSLCHLLGSISFCGVRALGDALAVNHAKRVNDTFTNYRVYGSYSYGILGLLIGYVNQGAGLLPDFVPGLLLNNVSWALTLLLVWLWPDEYFQMTTEDSSTSKAPSQLSLPGRAEIMSHMLAKLWPWSRTNQKQATRQQQPQRSASDAIKPVKRELSLSQQVEVFVLLIKNDFRIPLFLLLVLYCGFSCYAGLNFVFAYMYELCRDKDTYLGAEIASRMMFGYCVLESLAYKLANKMQRNSSSAMIFHIVFLCTCAHYCFYGLFIDRVSPHWFVVESLHGIEYAFSLTLCINLGYEFAREVDLIVPQLIDRGSIDQNDHEHQQLVRVSLMATMGSLYTLVYDGASCSIGALVFGQIAGRYSYQVLWLFISVCAFIGSVVLIIVQVFARALNIRPKILNLQLEHEQATKQAELT